MKGLDSGICTVLTIAGSDSIAGAGIQADLKTISAFGLYGFSVITAITAQNTQGVQGVSPVSANMIAKQLDSVFTDIMPDCVKIGMLVNEEIVETVAEKLEQYKPSLVVLDPIMVSSSGKELLNEKGREAMIKRLFPLTAIITPNLPEAKVLAKMAKRDVHSSDKKEMAEAIRSLFGSEMDRKHAVLIKGGHDKGEKSEDYLYCFWQLEEREFSFSSPKIDNPNTHGTGCTLSSAIACGLAKGEPLEISVGNAKKYIEGAIRGGLFIGKGIGPLDHFWNMEENSSKMI